MKKTVPILLLTFFFSLNLVAQQINWEPIIEINSQYDEFSPTISPDGKTILFGSSRPGGLGDKDIWLSHFNEKNKKWDKPQNFSILNSKWHDHEPCFSHDGNSILFTSDRIGGYGTGDIYISFKRDGKWQKPLNAGSPINSRDSEKMPSISMNNREIFFTRIPIDHSKRQLDLRYRQIYSSQSNDGIWTEPKPLPFPVNQLKLESASRIMADSKTLIFCSAREDGKGSYDIWKATRDSISKPWSKVTNLEEVNTEFSEVYFGTDTSGKWLFLSSNRNKRKNFDIYQAFVDKEINDPTITLQGKVIDIDSKAPIGSKITVEIFMANSDTNKYSIKSDSKTGKYSITLPKGDKYSITAETKGYMFYSHEIDTTNIDIAEIKENDIKLHPLKKGEKIVFNTIYFAPNSYQLLNSSEIALKRLDKILKDNPKIHIEISGHIARVKGAIGDGDKLSENRAISVMNYLIKRGIDPKRLSAVGKGDRKPIGSNKTEEGRSINRRTEIEIVE